MSATNLTTTMTTTTSQSRGIVNAAESRAQYNNREDPSVFQVPIHQTVPSIGTLMNIKRRMARWRTRGRDNIIGSTKSSIAMQGTRLRMENSYVLRPKEEERFNEEKVERILKGVLAFHLSNNSENYDPKSCAKLACRMTEDIKSRVKELRYTRYKVVAYVVVGKMNGQGTHLGSRGLWDTTCDGMASASMTAQQLFAVGVVFATYFE